MRQEHPADGQSQQQSARLRTPQHQCQRVVRQSKAGQRRNVGDGFVPAQHQTEATQQQQPGDGAVAPAMQLAAGHAAKQQGQRHVQARGQPRAVVQRQQRRGQHRGHHSSQIVKRRLIKKRFTCERGH